MIIQEWVDVKVKKPEEGQTVIVKTPSRQRVATYKPKEYDDEFFKRFSITWIFEDEDTSAFKEQITHWRYA